MHDAAALDPQTQRQHAPVVWRGRLPDSLSDWRRRLDALARSQGWPVAPWAGVAEGLVCLASTMRRPGLGRWTLLAVNPLAELRAGPDAASIRERVDGGWREVATFEDPFEGLEALLQPAQGVARPWSADGPPFAGGALGVVGYGCRAALEALSDDTPRWGEPESWWGLYDTFLAHDHHTHESWVVSWGMTSWDAPPDRDLAHRRVARWRRALETPSPLGEAAHLQRRRDAQPWSLRFEPSIDEASHATALSEILEGILAGRCYQVCHTFPMQASRPPQVRASDIFEALQARTPAPFAALLAPGGPLALAGASPERFLRVRGRCLEARPMKGTRRRDPLNPDRDAEAIASLRVSVKDQAENVMIVDLMRNDLGRVCELGSVRVPELFTVETYAAVHQMTSTITGRLREGASAVDVLRAGFPPGSMTGAPKVEAMRMIEALEIGPRGWYSGVLGHVGWDGDLDLSVVIRTALVSDTHVTWHVGGGVVADSSLSDEWLEALSKGPRALTGELSD